MKKQFLIIGLGRFGSSVAHTLIEGGYSVVGIDQSEEKIQKASEEMNDVIKCDATDADILESMDKMCIRDRFLNFPINQNLNKSLSLMKSLYYLLNLPVMSYLCLLYTSRCV